MAEGGSPVSLDHGAVGGDGDVSFDTPPESPRDMKIELAPEVQAELNEIESTEEYIKRNQEWIARSAESVRELQQTMEKLIGQTSSRKTELENRTQRIKQMKTEIEEISMEAIEKEEVELQKLIEIEKQQTTNGTNEPAESGEKGELEDLKEKVEAYRENLGIQVDTAKDWVEFLFTDIDTQSSETPFSIRLTVEGDSYKCVACEPTVDSIEELFGELNTHHDLPSFITKLRSEFQALVNKEN